MSACVTHGAERGLGAGIAEIVDPLDPDHGRDVGQADHITVQALQRRGAAAEQLRRVVRRSGHPIAADALGDHGVAVPRYALQARFMGAADLAPTTVVPPEAHGSGQLRRGMIAKVYGNWSCGRNAGVDDRHAHAGDDKFDSPIVGSSPQIPIVGIANGGAPRVVRSGRA